MTNPPNPPPPDPLQFDSAVPAAGAAAGVSCAECKEPIKAYYYEVGGQVVCARCKSTLETKLGIGVDAGPGKMARAALFGGLAAAVGAALYLGILIFLSLEIALIAILVGWMVGKAVRYGSYGRGGKRYQILALGLTYFAISVSYVPQMMFADDANRTAAAAVGGDSTAVASTVPDSALMAAAVRDSAALDSAFKAAESKGVGATIATIVFGLVVLLIIAPVKVVVTDFPGSALSILIIGFGLFQAWQMNRRSVVEFKGPFKVGGATPAEPAANG